MLGKRCSYLIVESLDRLSREQVLRCGQAASLTAFFHAVDDLREDQPIGKVLALLNATTQALNGVERDRLPDLMWKALKDRGRSGRF